MIKISKEEFHAHHVYSESGETFETERAWFKHGELLGVVMQGNSKGDWRFVALAENPIGVFRAIDADIGLATEQAATDSLFRCLDMVVDLMAQPVFAGKDPATLATWAKATLFALYKSREPGARRESVLKARQEKLAQAERAAAAGGPAAEEKLGRLRNRLDRCTCELNTLISASCKEAANFRPWRIAPDPAHERQARE